jgi:FtsH-binding integral membrane protein
MKIPVKYVRLIVAFLIAPISPGLALFPLAFTGQNPLQGIWGLGFAALIGYSVAIFLGVPCYIVLNRNNVDSIISYLLCGACFGIVICVVTGVFSLTLILLAILFGCLASAIFWLLARPDLYK